MAAALVPTGAVLDALDEVYPFLSGTIPEHDTKKRRAFMRFFTCQRDFSHEPVDAPVSEDVAQGQEPVFVVRAIAEG